jgi:hypothetical protein
MSFDTNSDEYWAALPPDRCCAEAFSRIGSYYQFIRTSQLNLWHRVYKAQNKGGIKLGRIWTGGMAGEQVLLEANHLRAINSGIVDQICQERPSFSAKATNSDFSSMAQCILAQNLLDYDTMRNKSLESVSQEAVDFAQWYGEGYIGKFWNATGGDIVGRLPGTEDLAPNPQTGLMEPVPGTGKPQWSGTLVFQSFPPWEVVRDFSEPDPRKMTWVIVREYVNKYDLAQKYPGKKREILNAPGRLESYAQHPTPAFYNNFTQMAFHFSDQVECFHFFHDKTAAMPHGRYMFIVGQTWVQDGPLPYQQRPLFRISAGRQEGTNFGYSINFDLLPIQHAIDAQYTTLATNHNAFGIQSVASPRQAALTPKMIGSGLVLLEYDPIPGVEGGGIPQGLNMLKVAPESLTWLEKLVGDLEAISGQNATTRGSPPENVSSGSMAALVVAQALKHTVRLQASYVQAMEECATATIQDYITFGDQQQNALIVGKSNARSYMKSFTGQDLSEVKRITVELQNPLLQTLAGKMQIADNLLAKGLVRTTQDYVQVLTTGRLEPIIDPAQSELMNVKAENEALSDGKDVQGLKTDDHQLHALHHKVLLDSPESRTNPRLVLQATNHIEWHLSMAKMMDPVLAAFLGIKSFAPPPVVPESQAAADPNRPDEPTAAKDISVAGPPQPGQPTTPVGTPAREPSMPQGPTNPMTGQKTELPKPAARVTPPGVKPASA